MAEGCARRRRRCCLLFLAALVAAAVADANSTTHGAVTQKPGEATDFYSYSCNADQFIPSLRSFSTIWTLVSLFVIVLASAVYLMYACFASFVKTMMVT